MRIENYKSELKYKDVKQHSLFSILHSPFSRPPASIALANVRRTVIKLLLLLLVIAVRTFAASGDYAYQAKKYVSQGRYGAAYGQYELALRESKKEADLAAEGRILTSMATIAAYAMEYEEAKKIFERVRINSLDEKGKEDFYKSYMEFYNMQGDYKKSYEIAKKVSFKKASAMFCGEAAIAAAGTDNFKDADSYFKKIDDDDSPGQYAYYKAKIADVKGENAEKLYKDALKLSVDKKQYFVSGTILLRLAEITKDKDYAKRSADVFRELGLAKPFQKAEGAAQ